MYHTMHLSDIRMLHRSLGSFGMLVCILTLAWEALVTLQASLYLPAAGHWLGLPGDVFFRRMFLGARNPTCTQ